MPTMILKCSCRHEYQDEKYGPGKRVHNLAPGKNRNEVTWRCTVCSLTRGGPPPERR